MAHYTIKQIAKEIGAGESTVRFWRDRHENFIPCIGKGRKRRYPQEALETLRFIAECSAEGKNADEITEALSSKYRIIEIQPEIAAAHKAEQQLPPARDNMTMLMDVMSQALSPGFEKLMAKLGQLDRLESIEQELKRSKTQESIITQQQKKIESLESHISELEAKLNRLFGMIEKQPSERAEPSQLSLFEKEQQKRTEEPETGDYRQGIVSRVVSMRVAGATWRGIADTFNSEGVPTLSGSGKHHAGTLANLLKQTKK